MPPSPELRGIDAAAALACGRFGDGAAALAEKNEVVEDSTEDEAGFEERCAS